MKTVSVNRLGPFGLVVTGEATDYVDALQRIVGPKLLATYRVRDESEVLELVQARVADAIVLDEDATRLDTLRLLRMIRQIDNALLVVLLASRADRRMLEEALRLAAFSVVTKPLRLEELLVQVHRMMVRLDLALRREQL